MDFLTQILFWFVGSILLYVGHLIRKALKKQAKWQEKEDACIKKRNEIIYIRAVRGRIKDMKEPSEYDEWKLAEWDVSNIINISDIFKNTTAFNQDLSAWLPSEDESTENKNSE